MIIVKNYGVLSIICCWVCLAPAASVAENFQPVSSARPQRVTVEEHVIKGDLGHHANDRDRSHDVDLLSPRGRRHVGDQLQAFAIDPDGIISSSKPAWLSLYYTENKPFRLSGEVWLGGASDELLFPGDLPDGFALFIREWDGLRRYRLTSRGARVKRRMYRGGKQPGIFQIANFEEKSLRKWIPFTVVANWDAIRFTFGNETITLEGPLDMAGANKIVIVPGTKLRNLRLGVLKK